MLRGEGWDYRVDVIRHTAVFVRGERYTKPVLSNMSPTSAE